MKIKAMADYRAMSILIGVSVLSAMLIGYVINASTETYIWMSALPVLAIPVIIAIVINLNRFMDD